MGALSGWVQEVSDEGVGEGKRQASQALELGVAGEKCAHGFVGRELLSRKGGGSG